MGAISGPPTWLRELVVTGGITADLPNARILGDVVHEQGLLAARPAATARRIGSYYTATDVGTGTTYRTDGAAWGQIAGAAGGNAPADASYITVNAEPNLSAESVLGTSIIFAGTIAARPAAATPGRIYYATDTNTAYRDSGAVWDQLGAPSTASYVTVAAEGNLSAESVLGTAIVMTGTDAARPAAGVNGRLYFGTTSTCLFRDTGAAWVAIAGPVGANYIVSNADTNLTAELVLGTQVVMRGTIAARPAASLAGLLYFSSDEVPPSGYRDNGASWDKIALAADVLTSSSANLAADAAMALNTLVDGPSLSLAAGTWLVIAEVTVTPGAGGTTVTLRIWDGTTVFSSRAGDAGGINGMGVTCTAIVTLASTTTVKMSAVANAASTMRATAPTNGAGANATHIRAVKIA